MDFIDKVINVWEEKEPLKYDFKCYVNISAREFRISRSISKNNIFDAFNINDVNDSIVFIELEVDEIHNFIDCFNDNTHLIDLSEE